MVACLFPSQADPVQFRIASNESVYGEMVATLASEATPNRGPGSSPGRRIGVIVIMVARLFCKQIVTVRFRVTPNKVYHSNL